MSSKGGSDINQIPRKEIYTFQTKEQNRTFKFDCEELCNASKIVNRNRRAGVFDEQVEDELAEVLPSVQRYVDRGIVPTPADVEWTLYCKQSYTTHILALYYFAENYGMDDFCSRILDELKAFDKRREQRVRLRHVTDAYTNTKKGSELRWYYACKVVFWLLRATDSDKDVILCERIDELLDEIPDLKDDEMNVRKMYKLDKRKGREGKDDELEEGEVHSATAAPAHSNKLDQAVVKTEDGDIMHTQNAKHEDETGKYISGTKQRHPAEPERSVMHSKARGSLQDIRINTVDSGIGSENKEIPNKNPDLGITRDHGSRPATNTVLASDRILSNSIITKQAVPKSQPLGPCIGSTEKAQMIVEKKLLRPEASTDRSRLSSNYHNEAAIKAASERRRLHIGNLAHEVTEAELVSFLKGYQIEFISIRNRDVRIPCAYAFVSLSTPLEAERAITELSGKIILARKITIELAQIPESSVNSCRLHIYDLKPATTQGDLVGFFKSYHVKNISFPIRRDTPKTGHAYVTLSTPLEASRAVAELAGNSILGTKISIRLAPPPKRRKPRKAIAHLRGASPHDADMRDSPPPPHPLGGCDNLPLRSFSATRQQSPPGTQNISYGPRRDSWDRFEEVEPLSRPPGYSQEEDGRQEQRRWEEDRYNNRKRCHSPGYMPEERERFGRRRSGKFQHNRDLIDGFYERETDQESLQRMEVDGYEHGYKNQPRGELEFSAGRRGGRAWDAPRRYICNGCEQSFGTEDGLVRHWDNMPKHKYGTQPDAYRSPACSPRSIQTSASIRSGENRYRERDERDRKFERVMEEEVRFPRTETDEGRVDKRQRINLDGGQMHDSRAPRKPRCMVCDQSFETKLFLLEHLADVPSHKRNGTLDDKNLDREGRMDVRLAPNDARAERMTEGAAPRGPSCQFRCNDCKNIFGSKGALQKHLVKFPSHKFGRKKS